MEILNYFDPVHFNEDESLKGELARNKLGKLIALNDGRNLGKINDYHLAIIGVPEGRGSMGNQGCEDAPDAVRKYLYQLYQGPAASWKIVDLGNLRIGASISDTYFALSNIVSDLIKAKVVPIILGGGQDLTFANFLAYKEQESTVNVLSIDSAFNVGDTENPELTSSNFMSRIILYQPNFMFNYSNIGYQTYFVNQEEVDLMTRLYFDTHRLGKLREDIKEAEPVIRNADFISFDVSAIRQSDAPGNANATPNGFYGEEACQLARYAGISDKLSSIGFYEINPSLDTNGQTAHLVAQMIWYFIEGYYARKGDFPVVDKIEYTKYNVSIKNGEEELLFYKSPKSDRWWMDVPYPSNNRIKYQRHLLLPCSYTDYELACQDQIPDRWWKTYEKLR